MTEKTPKIIARRRTKISPWMDIIEREVAFASNAPVQSYHAVGQADYVSILAVTPDRRLPIVRQYRPAIEAYTWELPAGLVDEGEDASEACHRELVEETGYPPLTMQSLGVAAPCTGRFSNRIHSFFVETDEQISGFEPEAGLTVALVSPAELAEMIHRGEFISQLHLGTIALAILRSLIAFPLAAKG
jgi:ADP-ribose pyrophosphatase